MPNTELMKLLSEAGTPQETFNILYPRGYVRVDNEPHKCFKCDSVALEETIKGTEANVVSEYEVTCGGCGQVLGYWAFGYWQA